MELDKGDYTSAIQVQMTNKKWISHSKKIKKEIRIVLTYFIVKYLGCSGNPFS